MRAHPLTGRFSVEASARRARQYRYVEERLMRVMGGWIALTPEVPAKLLFGRHVWECAQHADLWGKRLPELREPAQESEPANAQVVAFMDLLESPEQPGQTIERITGVYRVLKPHLVSMYEHHLGTANAVYEPPTRRVLERCLEEERRHVAAGAVVLRYVAQGSIAQNRIAEWGSRLRAALEKAGGVTGDASVSFPNDVSPGDARYERDVVILDPAFDLQRVEPAVLTLLERHASAVAAGAWEQVAADLAPDAGPGIMEAYERAGLADRGVAIVALAKIGAFRVAKIRLSGARGATILQVRCRQSGDRWQVIAAEIVRTEPPA